MKAHKSRSDDKVAYVLGEFKRGKLKDGAGNIITDRNRAVAIALSEAGLSNKSLQKSEMLAKARMLRKSIESQLKKELESDESFRKELFGYFKGNPAPVVSDVMSIAEKHGVTGNDAFSFVGKMLSDSISAVRKAKAEVGAVHTWADGSKHKKESDGTWSIVAGDDDSKKRDDFDSEEKGFARLDIETEESYKKYIDKEYMGDIKKFENEDIGNGRTGGDVLESMFQYSNFWYKDINKDLRNETVDDEKEKKYISDIGYFIDRFRIKSPIKLYRGLDLEGRELKKGDIFLHKSFGSFSSDPFRATQFGGDSIIECVFKDNDKVAPMIAKRINVKERSGEIEGNSIENEFIAQKELKYKVISKTKKKSSAGVVRNYYKVEVYE